MCKCYPQCFLACARIAPFALIFVNCVWFVFGFVFAGFFLFSFLMCIPFCPSRTTYEYLWFSWNAYLERSQQDEQLSHKTFDLFDQPWSRRLPRCFRLTLVVSLIDSPAWASFRALDAGQEAPSVSCSSSCLKKTLSPLTVQAQFVMSSTEEEIKYQPFEPNEIPFWLKPSSRSDVCVC